MTATLTERPPTHQAPADRPTSDEAEVRSLIAAWSRALEAKDIDGLTANYAPDAVLFHVMPPYKTEGVAAIRRLRADCLPHFPKSFRSEHRELTLTVGGDLAFWHGLHHMKPDEPGDPAGRTWVRVTGCFRKVAGRWQVVHEHVSVPFDCATGQVSPIVDPGGTAGAA